MKRRSFIKNMSYVSVGLFFSTPWFGKASHKLISIDSPSIQTRHGYFNIDKNFTNNFHIQRDIFTANGLDKIDENRITNITFHEDSKKYHYIIKGIDNTSSFENLDCISFNEQSNLSKKGKKGSIIFSELYDFKINNKLIKKNEAFLLHYEEELNIWSSENQFIFILNQRI